MYVLTLDGRENIYTGWLKTRLMSKEKPEKESGLILRLRKKSLEELKKQKIYRLTIIYVNLHILEQKKIILWVLIFPEYLL